MPLSQSQQAPARYVEWFTPGGAVYDETGRAIDVLALVSLTDLQRYKDIGASLAAVGVVTATDAQRYKDIGLAVPLTAVLTAADAVHGAEPLSVNVAAAVALAVETYSGGEALALTAQAQAALTDLQHYRDLATPIPVSALVELAETFHGAAPLESLAVVVVASVTAADTLIPAAVLPPHFAFVTPPWRKSFVTPEWGTGLGEAYAVELEDGTGYVLLEDGSRLMLEAGVVPRRRFWTPSWARRALTHSWERGFTTAPWRNLDLPARPPRHLEYRDMPVVAVVDVTEGP